MDDVFQLGPDISLRLQHCLAQSTYGEIWRATWREAGCDVVIKRVNQVTMAQYPEQAGEWPASLNREIAFLQSIRSPRLVRLLRHGKVNGLPWLVLEPMACSLAQAIEQEAIWSAEQVTRTMRQLIEGVQVLHRRGLRHLDLKPANILIGNGAAAIRSVKLADFGTLTASNHGMRRLCGTSGWQAPEQFFPAQWHDGQFAYRSDAQSDAFALGLIAYYLLFREKTGFAQWMMTQHRQGGEQAAWTQRAAAPAYLTDAELQRVAQRWGKAGARWLWRVLMERQPTHGL